jgi:hypothetical protein
MKMDLRVPSATDKLFIEYEKEVNKAQHPIIKLLAKGHDEAIKKSIQFFKVFNWNDPPYKVFIEDQRKFLERRI